MGFMDTGQDFITNPWPFRNLPGCKLLIHLVSIGGVPRAGVEFTVELRRSPATAGGALVDPTPLTGLTNAEGVLNLVLSQGAQFLVSSWALRGVKVPIDTTDKTEINLAEVIAAL